jgi:hypothetical protein
VPVDGGKKNSGYACLNCPIQNGIKIIFESVEVEM